MSIELTDFVEKTQRECAASTARIDRVSARTRRRNAYGYRKLFPWSMLTLLVSAWLSTSVGPTAMSDSRGWPLPRSGGLGPLKANRK